MNLLTNLSKLDEIKKETKDVTDAINKKTKQCKYNRKGYCRVKGSCPFFHSTKICEDIVAIGVCKKNTWFERHPDNCYNITQSECQWGRRCQYLHREQMIQIIKKYESSIEESDTDDEQIVEINNEEITENILELDV